MRSLLIIALTLSSCYSENCRKEILFSNKYIFARECILSTGKLVIPKKLILKEANNSLLFTNYLYEDEKVKLKIMFDSNPSERNITDLDLYNHTGSLADYYNKEEGTISGKLSQNIFVHIFSIASGYCSMIFEFNDSLSLEESGKLFNEFIENIKIISLPNQPKIINGSFIKDSVVSIKKNDLGSSKYNINGDLIISKSSNNVIFINKTDVNFDDCDHLQLYYTILIDPYYEQLSDGTILTILSKDISDIKYLNDNVLMQFVVRKNKSKSNIYSDGKLSPIYMNKSMKIRNKNAVEQ